MPDALRSLITILSVMSAFVLSILAGFAALFGDFTFRGDEPTIWTVGIKLPLLLWIFVLTYVWFRRVSLVAYFLTLALSLVLLADLFDFPDRGWSAWATAARYFTIPLIGGGLLLLDFLLARFWKPPHSDELAR